MLAKHFKLITSSVLLVSLTLLPNISVNKTIDKPAVIAQEIKKPQVVVITKEELSKRYIRKQLNTVYDLPPKEIEWWVQHVAAASNRHNVPEKYMISVLAVESNFDKFPDSPNHLVGPGQISYNIWKGKTGYNLKDPGQNIMATAYILNHYKKQCGNWECALRSYNVGIGDYKMRNNLRKQNQYIALINKEIRQFKET